MGYKIHESHLVAADRKIDKARTKYHKAKYPEDYNDSPILEVIVYDNRQVIWSGTEEDMNKDEYVEVRQAHPESVRQFIRQPAEVIVYTADDLFNDCAQALCDIVNTVLDTIPNPNEASDFHFEAMMAMRFVMKETIITDFSVIDLYCAMLDLEEYQDVSV